MAASDAVGVLHSTGRGDERAARFYLRSAVEAAFAHIYFSAHPAEFRFLTTRAGYHVSVENLTSFCRELAVCRGAFASRFDNLIRVWKDLSRDVHGRPGTSSTVRPALTRIKLDDQAIQGLLDCLRDAARDVALLLLWFHHDVVRRLGPFENQFVLGFLDQPRRNILRSAAIRCREAW